MLLKDIEYKKVIVEKVKEFNFLDFENLDINDDIEIIEEEEKQQQE